MTDEERLLVWTEAYLAGYDRGYQMRVLEENGAYPEPKVFAFGGWFNQALEREKADRLARQQRPTDIEVRP